MTMPDIPISDIVIAVLKQAVGAASIAALAWFSGPLKWMVQNRRLKRLLTPERKFLFVFNTSAEQAKVVTFLSGGLIGEGQNENEHTWRIKRGKLEILAADGRLYSRFTHHQESGQLKHTNDTDCRSLPNQYFEPSLIRVQSAAAQPIIPPDVVR